MFFHKFLSNFNTNDLPTQLSSNEISEDEHFTLNKLKQLDLILKDLGQPLELDELEKIDYVVDILGLDKDRVIY